MSIKGQVVGAISQVAAGSLLRSSAELLLTAVGHRYPTSKTVQSFCRHFGEKLMAREGASFGRVATFASGGRMYCGPDQIGFLSLMHYFLGTITGQTQDERPIVKLLDRVVRHGDVFFDVGANLGFYSFYVGPLCGKTGAIHAFEANPRLIPHLANSIELNKPLSNINLTAVAVGKQSNTFLPLYDPDRIGCSSLHQHQWLNKDSMVQVPVITLDEYVKKNGVGRIDVMKIDIEGAELEAFQGMEEVFRTCPPGVIICELMPFENVWGRDRIEVLHRADSAAGPSEIVQYLQSKGYDLYHIESADGRLRLLQESPSTIENTQRVDNVSFVYREFREKRPGVFVTV